MIAVPTVSVVIPCYNGAKFLPETLRSVLAQTVPVHEILVIDDGSTDDSAAVAEAFGPPVRVIRQPNQGESVARNRGIDEATGAWVAFLDADDLWEPTKTEKQLAAASPDAGAVCTAHYNFFKTGVRKLVVTPTPEFFTRDYMFRHGSPCQVATLMVRRGIPCRFPDWTRHGEDLVFFLDLIGQTDVRIVPEPLVGYRQHATSQSRRSDIHMLWHDTLEEWLRRHAGIISPAESDRYRQLGLAKVASAANTVFASCDWAGVEEYRQYLNRYARDGYAVQFPPRKRFPGWVYSIYFCDLFRPGIGIGRFARRVLALVAPATRTPQLPALPSPPPTRVDRDDG